MSRISIRLNNKACGSINVIDIKLSFKSMGKRHVLSCYYIESALNWCPNKALQVSYELPLYSTTPCSMNIYNRFSRNFRVFITTIYTQIDGKRTFLLGRQLQQFVSFFFWALHSDGFANEIEIDDVLKT